MIDEQISEIINQTRMIKNAVVQITVVVALSVIAISAMLLGGQIGYLMGGACAAAITVIVAKTFQDSRDSSEGDENED